MTVVTPSYGTLTTLAITLFPSGLSDANLASGRQSAIITNSSICGVDIQIQGYFTLGTGLATIAKQVEIWFFGANDGINYSGNAVSGGDSNLNVCGVKTNMKLAEIIPISSTTAATLATKKIVVGPYSMAAAFGGSMPIYSGLFIVQNTCGTLFSLSGGHEFTYQPIFYASN